jgi:hypothetical protein
MVVETTAQPVSVGIVDERQAGENEEVQALREQIKAKDKEFDDLKAKHIEDTTTKDNEIALLGNNIIAKDNEIALLGNNIIAKDNEIALLGNTITTKDDAIVKLKKDSTTMNTEIIALDIEIHKAREEVKGLKLTHKEEMAKIRQTHKEQITDANTAIERYCRAPFDAKGLRLEDYHGVNNVQAFMVKNFEPRQIKSIEKNPLLVKTAAHSAKLFNANIRLMDSEQAALRDHDATKKTLVAVLERCRGVVDVKDIEGVKHHLLSLDRSYKPLGR